MSYKVFLVEDEIVTREGIRDNVDWKFAEFEFCGEASDGEVALPLIEASKPDLLITDIKMPFMDGLQLSKIIREHMPWIKIIILSGHDEFDYAKVAIKIGVTEYLLKPISSDDLIEVLKKVALSLDQESKERESLKDLKEQAEESLILLREKFLLRLVMGGEKVIHSILQPEIRESMFTVLGKTYFRTISPPHMSILTDRELIMIREELTRRKEDRYGFKEITRE